MDRFFLIGQEVGQWLLFQKNPSVEKKLASGQLLGPNMGLSNDRQPDFLVAVSAASKRLTATQISPKKSLVKK